MINEKIYLDPNDKAVVLETFVHNDADMPVRDALLIFPGGGYTHVCAFREGECIATAFASRGVNAFVLTYRVGPEHRYPSQLIDAARAMAYIKENAQKYKINPDRVFTLGFSAGGHLCGNLATEYEKAEELLSLKKDTARPCGSVYCYPVVSAVALTHSWSFQMLTGKDFKDLTEEEKRAHSNELRVNEKTPPAFIWHTAEDETVPIMGSLRLCSAYVDAGVPVEMHVYPYGPHGLALATELTSNGNEDFIQPRAAEWVDKAVGWMKTV